jgi:hypothetical protein
MSLISELKAIQDRHGYLPEEEFQDPLPASRSNITLNFQALTPVGLMPGSGADVWHATLLMWKKRPGNRECDPYNKTPEFKFCVVKVERGQSASRES